MGIYVNPNNENLKIDMASPIYVDKSMLISEINRVVKTNKRFVCVSRSRRFGKTMAGNMLSAYFSKGCDSRELFSKLKIAKHPSFDKYLNKFNVIALDVNVFFSKYGPSRDIVPLFTKNIRDELISAFPQVKIPEDEPLAGCLERIYAATEEQFVVILDEYDVLVREKVAEPIFKSYLAFLNSMFKNNNLASAIALAYITGILPVVRDKVQSKLNVFDEYSMAGSGRLSEFVGFAAEEVQELCKENGLDFEECKRWYDGYNINGIETYNPKSIVSAIDNGEIGSYWTQTGSYEALQNYVMMNFDGILEDVKTMIGGGRVDVNVISYLNTMTDFHSKDDVFTYLIHLGYLAYDRNEKQCYIPNREVRDQWIQTLNLASKCEDSSKLINATFAEKNNVVESIFTGT